ncbi:MAG: AbrB/MazE/SpoVT family DNA-binding domain-containing protein [Nitrospira sp.]|nr:AbrB/MazE/SpoVT family DNA-binding domain-containing protein [Nitrospira sp.]
MPTSTVTSKGQTTIPKEIRDHLHLKPGDRVEFVTDEDGRVVLLAATVDVAELAVMLKNKKKIRLSRISKNQIRRNLRSCDMGGIGR